MVNIPKNDPRRSDPQWQAKRLNDINRRHRLAAERPVGHPDRIKYEVALAPLLGHQANLDAFLVGDNKAPWRWRKWFGDKSYEAMIRLGRLQGKLFCNRITPGGDPVYGPWPQPKTARPYNGRPPSQLALDLAALAVGEELPIPPDAKTVNVLSRSSWLKRTHPARVFQTIRERGVIRRMH